MISFKLQIQARAHYQFQWEMSINLTLVITGFMKTGDGRTVTMCTLTVNRNIANTKISDNLSTHQFSGLAAK